MDEWNYNPATHLDPALVERLHSELRDGGMLVRGARSTASLAVRAWLRVYHRLTIVGRQSLPLKRSFVLIANHASHLDTLCLLAALPIGRLERVFPVAARDYFCVGVVRMWLAKLVANPLPFDRCFAPWQSLGACAHLLETPGTILIVYPEGTRGAGDEPGEFKPGAALLAVGRDVPIVPCHLAGTGAALPKGAWCPRPMRLQLTIGEPRFYSGIPATKEAARRVSRELREAVLALARGQTEPKVDGRAGGEEAFSQPQLQP